MSRVGWRSPVGEGVTTTKSTLGHVHRITGADCKDDKLADVYCFCETSLMAVNLYKQTSAYESVGKTVDVQSKLN